METNKGFKKSGVGEGNRDFRMSEAITKGLTFMSLESWKERGNGSGLKGISYCGL